MSSNTRRNVLPYLAFCIHNDVSLELHHNLLSGSAGSE